MLATFTFSYDCSSQVKPIVLCPIPRRAANLVGFCSPFFTDFSEPKTEPTIRPKNGSLKLNCASGAKFLVPYFGAALSLGPRMWAEIAQTYEQGQQKIGSRNADKLVARARTATSHHPNYFEDSGFFLKYIAACHCMQLWWSTSQHIYATGTRTHSVYIYTYIYHGLSLYNMCNYHTMDIDGYIVYLCRNIYVRIDTSAWVDTVNNYLGGVIPFIPFLHVLALPSAQGLRKKLSR